MVKRNQRVYVIQTRVELQKQVRVKRQETVCIARGEKEIHIRIHSGKVSLEGTGGLELI